MSSTTNYISFTFSSITSGTTLYLPVACTGTNTAYVGIDWGDGTIETWTATSSTDLPNHQYSADFTNFTVYIQSNSSVSTIDFFFSAINSSYITSGNTFFTSLSNFNWITALPGGIVTFSLEKAFYNVTSDFTVSFSEGTTPIVVDTSSMFYGATAFNGALPDTFDTSAVTNMSYMFFEAESFNTSLPNSFTTSAVTSLTYMFAGAVAYNQALPSPFVNSCSSVTDMSYMFYNATAFNNGGSSLTFTTSSALLNTSYMFYNCSGITSDVNISVSDTNSVIDMSYMFYGATNFNQYLPGFGISSVIDMTYMFDGITVTDVSNTNFNNFLSDISQSSIIQPNVTLGATGNLVIDTTTGSAYDILASSPNNWIIITTNTCFLKGTKILTDKGYIAIENMREGDLVKTLNHGLVPIHLVGKSFMHNVESNERLKDNLYKYSMDSNHDLIEDLVITGGHAVLVDKFNSEEEELLNRKFYHGGTFVTDGKLQLLACVDKNAEPYNNFGKHEIYHLALENEDKAAHYGIYANGLLVESCSIDYLKHKSGMEFL